MGEHVASSIIRSLPNLMIDVGGIVYAVVRWRQHPRLSALIMAAALLSVGGVMFIHLALPHLSSLYNTPGWLWIQAVLTTLGTGSHLLMMLAAFYGFHEGVAFNQR